MPLGEQASCASKYDIIHDSDQSRSKFDERVDTWLELGAKDAKDLLKLQTYVPVLVDLERGIYCKTEEQVER